MRLSPHDPNLGVFLAVLGACHLLLKHADQATDLLRRARAANPQYWYIHFWLAGALGFKGNLDEARQSVPPPSSGAFDCGRARGTESLQTPRWREMDSNFQYASTVRWHRATDLPLPPTVKRRSAGRPPPMARPRSEAQPGSVRARRRDAVPPIARCGVRRRAGRPLTGRKARSDAVRPLRTPAGRKRDIANTSAMNGRPIPRPCEPAATVWPAATAPSPTEKSPPLDQV